MSEPNRAGLDEVGYGALAGPIISVVTVFRDRDLVLLPPGVKDSKQTTEAQRQGMYLRLCDAAQDIGVGHAWPWEIDELGVSAALHLSYRRALEELRVQPHILIVDGSNQVKGWKGKQINEPKADVKYPEVSAASIIAKHFRDTIMRDYAKELMKEGIQYGWEDNKGYGTPDHEAGIRRFGLLLNPSNRNRYLHRKRYCSKFMCVRI